MSLYHYRLKKDIKYFRSIIKRNNENIKIIREEMITGENVISFTAHYNLIKYYIFHNAQLKEILRRRYRLIH